MFASVVSSIMLLWLSCGVAPGDSALIRPTDIRFAFVASVDAAFHINASAQLLAGLRAAEYSVAASDLLEGTTLHFDFVPIVDPGNATAVQATIASTMATPNFFGFVMSDWDVTPYVYAAVNSSVPVVAARSLTDSEYATNATLYKNIISLRSPISSQYRVMLKHATGSEITQYARFAVIIRNEFLSTAQLINRTMLYHYGYEAPLIISLGPLDDNAVTNTTDVLDRWIAAASSSTAKDFPKCALFFAMQSDVVSILGAMYADSRFVMSAMAFYTTDYAAPSAFIHPLYGTRPFSRLFLIAGMSNPAGSTSAAMDYRHSLGQWLATNPSLPPSISTGVYDPNPTYGGYEAFQAAMLIANQLKLMPSITPDKFISELYDRTYVSVDDDLLGPFSDHCYKTETANLSCFCNIGAQLSHITVVDAATGLMAVAVDPSNGTSRYLSMSPGSGECYPTDTQLPIPARFQLYAPADASAATTAVWVAQIFGELQARARLINEAGVLKNIDFSVAYMNTFLDVSEAIANPLGTLERVYRTRRPFFIMGNWWDSEHINLPVINLNFAPTPPYVEPPPTTPTAFTMYTWTFKPVLADQIHTCVQGVLHAFSSSPDVLIAAADAQAYDLVVKSFHTFQVNPLPGGWTDLSQCDGLTNIVLSGLNQAASGRNTVLFFASFTSATITCIVNAIVAANTAYAANIADPSGTFDNFAVAIAADQTALYNAKIKLNATSRATLLHFPIYFASYLPPYFETGNIYRQDMSATWNTTSETILDAVTYYAIASITELFSTSLQKVTAATPTPTDVAKVVFDQGLINSRGMVFGPFYPDNCTADEIANPSPSRKCQCFKAVRTFSAYDFRGWLTGSDTYNPEFSWTMSTCGVKYEPLIVPSKLNLALIVGLAVPFGLVLVGIIVYVACFHGRRSNRTAPKDPNVPFAIVFTDVQSSTALWARVPEVMGPALEQHHDILRRLVSKRSGYEVKTIGDSFMVAFKSASNAAKFALDIQTELFNAQWDAGVDEVYVSMAQEAWEEKNAECADFLSSTSDAPQSGGAPSPMASGRPTIIGAESANEAVQQWQDPTTYAVNWHGIRVRVGMHWGAGSIKFDPVSQGFDYYGTLVNTAARVEGVGNGGQVLVTKDMFDQLEVEQFDWSRCDVLPMGPQPLRGLDHPVALYQLSPLALKTRQFNALRLDIEKEVEDDSETTETNGAEVVSSSAGAVGMSWETYLDFLLRHQKNPLQHRDFLARVTNFLRTALKTCPAAFQKDTIKTLSKRWHIKLRRRPAGEPDERSVMFDLAAISVKIGLAAEEAQRLAYLKTQQEALGSASNTGVTDSRFRRDSGQAMAAVRRKSNLGDLTPMRLNPGQLYAANLSATSTGP